MVGVLKSSWALFLGLLLMMLGNGIQGTLLGLRGAIEGFSTFEMSLVMSAYFVGFLFGSRMAPELIRRVGHVRVFAALGSLTSAVLILYPTIADPIAWIALRILIGFCFSGIYVTAESWLNNSVENENRGKALSLYLIVQMAGIIAAQGLVAFGDPGGFVMFVIPSVLISIAFAPILLSVAPTPAFDRQTPMSPLELYRVSPLGCIGAIALGGAFSAMFGMSAVYGTEAGFSISQISFFIAMIYVGGLVCQYPIGWLSDRMDRRILILGVSVVGGFASLLAALFGSSFVVVVIASFLLGGSANPLYALLVAYVNDYLDGDRMAGASGAMVFVNGVGAVSGPLITGWMMQITGPRGFWLFVAMILLGLSVYAVIRMRLRPTTVSVEETAPWAPVSQVTGVYAGSMAQDYYADASEESVSDPATNEISREPLG